MSNPSKKKGTAYETELVRFFESNAFKARRLENGSRHDIEVRSRYDEDDRVVEALATRPDRGRTLVAVRLEDFFDLLDAAGWGANVEAKRYAQFAHHTIFEKKFGR